MTRLKDRVAIVTGGGRGIGAGIARSLADAGARVAVNYTNGKDAAATVAADIPAVGGQAMTVQADVSLEPDVQRMFAQVRATYGPVDLLVNNAGVWHFQPIVDVSVAEYHRHYNTNVLGNVLTSQEFARQEEADGGTIVNLTSVGIDPAAPGTSLYIGTKSALVGMTRVLAVELAPRRIRVNAVAAGLIDTEGTRASGFVGSAAADDFVQTIPLQRMGTADDVSTVVPFLASDDARYITGDVNFAAGGSQLV